MKNLAILLFLSIFGIFYSQEKVSTKSENVKIISEKFEIPQLKTTRRIWIYLPPDYATSKKIIP